MKIFKTLLLVVCLLLGAVLVWDALPFHASADNEAAMTVATDQLETAVFAGGCFWCMEGPFDELDGVVATTSGYTGGDQVDPTYGEVSAGGTGHLESVQVTYDPQVVGYDRLLEVFWHNIDPLDARGQFCDKGSQYRSAIFVDGEDQRQVAIASKADIQADQNFQQPIATEILPAQPFYPAEEYHQDYYLKHPVRYRFYRNGCGRDRRLEQLWGSSH